MSTTKEPFSAKELHKMAREYYASVRESSIEPLPANELYERARELSLEVQKQWHLEAEYRDRLWPGLEEITTLAKVLTQLIRLNMQGETADSEEFRYEGLAELRQAVTKLEWLQGRTKTRDWE